ncbi:aminoacyl-tRNA hydrolase [Marinobacter maritimus]|uniref:aminoacyl-tRNA hydrolase n=1 Tax=Marinobacter maritimus TaxID=277961 RepID=UPI0011A2667E|nr:aminoacyl-tRNA hydrolase [Marinobacter maritimus]
MIRRVQQMTSNYLYKWLRSGLHLFRFWSAFIYSKKLKKTVCFVGITGSAGKTTTKDISANILRTAGECFNTPGTENYSHSIAKLLLKVRPRHRFCVLECSGGEPGELNKPLRLFAPNIAVLTLIARDHFKAFKSLEAIAEEKSKLVSALPIDGVAVLNIDDPLVRAIGESCNRKIIWVGKADGATIRLLSARSKWPEPLTLEVKYEGTTYQVPTSFHGKQLALSVLSALGVGLAAGIPLTSAISAVAEVRPAEGRMEVVSNEKDFTFLRDDWKAPHWSFSAPLEFMAEADARRKIIIIGTLSDYSLSASKLYPKVARQALEVGDIVIFVGPHAPRAAKAKRDTGAENLHAFTEIREASAFLNALLEPGDLVLLKGSNKADHLVRLMYNTQNPVGCWANQCGVANFCCDCPRLYKPMPASAAIIPLAGNDSGRKVIVGLGNPGSSYENTPHNAGYRVLDRMATRMNGLWVSFAEGAVCEVDIAGETVSLFKPAAQMNHSGPSTRQFLDRMGTAINDCLVVHDEMDLTLGQVKLKQGGGDAGHKGLKSLVASLGSHEFKRMRIGVRRPDNTNAAKNSVLQPFSDSDETALEPSVDRAVDILLNDVAGSAL